MSRTITLLVAIILALAAFLLFRNLWIQQPNEAPVGEELTSLSFHNWLEFSPPSGRFQVLIPGLPQHATDTITDPQTKEQRTYETYISADENGAAFMISAITFPERIERKADEEYLKQIITDILSRNKENKLKNMKIGNFRNLKALDFSFTSNEMLISGKVFARTNTLYILSMAHHNELFSPKQMDFFINSFSVIDDPQERPTPRIVPRSTPKPSMQ